MKRRKIHNFISEKSYHNSYPQLLDATTIRDGARTQSQGCSSINKKNFETPNKHSFNKPSTKKNTQYYCFLRYYNAVIYENGTYLLFKSSKSSIIESVLIVTAISLSMNNIIVSDKNSSSILLRRSVLITFIAENAHSVVAVEMRRVSTSLTTL